MATSGLEQQRADAIALRDRALASLQRETHGVELQQGIDSTVQNAGAVQGAKSNAAAATSDQDAETAGARAAAVAAGTASAPMSEAQKQQREETHQANLDRTLDRQATNRRLDQYDQDRIDLRNRQLDQQVTGKPTSDVLLPSTNADTGDPTKISKITGLELRNVAPVAKSEGSSEVTIAGVHLWGKNAPAVDAKAGYKSWFDPATDQDVGQAGYEKKLNEVLGVRKAGGPGMVSTPSTSAQTSSPDAGPPPGYAYAGIATDGSGRTVYQDSSGNKIAR